MMTVTCDQALNGTNIFIGDEVTFDITVQHHENISTKAAKKLVLTFATDLLGDNGITQTGVTKTTSNDTHFSYRIPTGEYYEGTHTFVLKAYLSEKVDCQLI